MFNFVFNRGYNPLNGKKNRPKIWLLIFLILLIGTPLAVLLIKRMEGRVPTLTLGLNTSAIGAECSLPLQVADSQNGIREIWVALLKDGKETILLEKKFPFRSILAGGAVREEQLTIPVNPKARNITDGKAVLRVVARDYSWRKWGAGNQNYQEHEVVIDTQAPTVSVMSLPLNLNQGGSGLVIYKLSEDCATSGVKVGEDFYPGYPKKTEDSLTRMTFIALNHTQGRGTQLSVTATDFAGNQGQVGLPCHTNAKKFRQDKIVVSENFLNVKMPEFLNQIPAASGEAMIDVFLKVNRDLRKENNKTLVKYTTQPETKILWEGAFSRLTSAANRASFADHRQYIYQGKIVDEQNHMGIDLASLTNSPVPAANSGKVVMVDSVGIYGGTVMIDHGFGLFSMYSHLSAMDVTPGQMVVKGDIIGKTGMTGLAGGDHLHYAMLVNKTFINPIEWWDAQWIKNNILTKIDAVN